MLCFFAIFAVFLDFLKMHVLRRNERKGGAAAHEPPGRSAEIPAAVLAAALAALGFDCATLRSG